MLRCIIIIIIIINIYINVKVYIKKAAHKTVKYKAYNLRKRPETKATGNSILR